ncbi:hypothetical protein HaLaN_20988, partial [Haematococcus lacustris]
MEEEDMQLLVSALQQTHLAGCSAPPVGASGEEEDLEAVHELRASQALPDGHVMLSRPCLQPPLQQWQPGGDALRSSLTGVGRAVGDTMALAWPLHSRVEAPSPAAPSHDPAALSLTSEKLSSILAYLDD